MIAYERKKAVKKWAIESEKFDILNSSRAIWDFQIFVCVTFRFVVGKAVSAAVNE